MSIHSSIEKSLNYLIQHQYENGQFCSYTATDDAMIKNLSLDNSIFPTALIALALVSLKSEERVLPLLKRCEGFFTEQMLQYGVWQHFTRGHVLYSLNPADLDDTVCISLFLEEMGDRRIRNYNCRLIANNRNSKGLFYTWLTFRMRLNRDRSYWRIVLPDLLNPVKSILFWRKMECDRDDIDAVVNSNVLSYLGKNKTTKSIIPFLMSIIKESREEDCDKWYRNPFTVYYFISKNYFRGIDDFEVIRPMIAERIISSESPDGRLGTCILDTALGISILLNLGYPATQVERAVAYLINNQKHTGEWERWIVYYGGPKKLIGWGSEELTTALCVEALYAFEKALKSGA